MNGPIPNYATWFHALTGYAPHAWQARLGDDAVCGDRVLRIPTGFGKTAGVVLPWIFRRVVAVDPSWPRRLVYCLPMRILVEQTADVVRRWLAAAMRVSEDEAPVHVLMGGVEAARWELHPERDAVLVGTQDMLLSRALNRGYGEGRARWPWSYGLLHHDALWVYDEVQLMDVAAATSAQIAAFRRTDAAAHGAPRPFASWWMSATLQPEWLATVDHAARAAELAQSAVEIPAAARAGGLWEVSKSIETAPAVATEADIARLAASRHTPGTLTLIVVNQVSRAKEVFRALDDAMHEGKKSHRRRRADAPDLRLVHSRFRGIERAAWRTGEQAFLDRESSGGERLPPGGRIVVATQVIEAGVDISARLLVTDLAPWSSLIQRFGRCARYGGEGGAIVVVGSGTPPLPYEAAAVDSARAAIDRLIAAGDGASPRAIGRFEDDLQREDPDLHHRLYRYEPAHVLRRRDFDGLFDTTPDLSGTDLDVSLYIRVGEERDVRLFWRPIEPPWPRTISLRVEQARDAKAAQHARAAQDAKATQDADAVRAPARRDELCPAPIGEVRAWCKAGAPVYYLDYVARSWVKVSDASRIVPGMTLLVPCDAGGYHPTHGFDAKSAARVAPMEIAPAHVTPIEDALASADGADEDDSPSLAAWKTIATHGRETEGIARTIAVALGLDARYAAALGLAGRWHDFGKAHPQFQGAIRDEARARDPLGVRRDLAKAPKGSWTRYERRGFRHELASTLSLLELLRRYDADHPALLGPHRALLEAIGATGEPVADEARIARDDALLREVAALGPDVNLLLWLVCTHHGKVRATWTSTRHDQDKADGRIHGVRDGDPIAATELCDGAGTLLCLPQHELSLTPAAMGVGARYGASWGERVAALVAEHGATLLAYLEAIMRAADARASMLTTDDPIR